MHTLRGLYRLYFAHKNSALGTVGLHLRGLDAFEEFLRSEKVLRGANASALPRHLTDDNLALFQRKLLERGQRESTVEGVIKKLLALWRWARERGLVKTGPLISPVVPPDAVPVGWLEHELRTLYRHLARLKGTVEGIPLSDYWLALHDVFWDTSERSGAIFALRPEWIDFDSLTVTFPARARKGRKRWASYSIHPKTAARLRKIISARRPLVFPRPYPKWPWYAYKSLLFAAGLPHDSAHTFQTMRRSVFSYFEAAGENSTELAGHSTRQLTVRKYHDPRIVKRRSPADVLRRPDEDLDDAA